MENPVVILSLPLIFIVVMSLIKMAKKRSAWIVHMMKVRKANPGKPLKVIMKLASKTWKKKS